MTNLKFETLSNKKKITLISFLVILIVGCVLVVYKLNKTHSVESDDIFANQFIDGLSFENAELNVKDGESIFSVEVFNETEDVYNLKNIYVMIEDSGEEHKLVGYIGEKIEIEEGKYLETKIDTELDDVSRIEYIINK